MARNRMIKSAFWTDAKMCKLKREVRLMYIGMWNFADDFGVISADAMLIKSSVFPLDDLKIKDVEEWLHSLEEAKVLIRFSYQDSEFFWITNFSKHQVINRPNTKDVNVPREVLDDIIQQYNEQQVYGRGVLVTPAPIQPTASSTGTEPPLLPTEEVPDETDADDYAKFKKWLADNAPTILKMSQPITKDEFVRLKQDFSVQYIMDLFLQMHNWKPLLSKCKSANLTFRNWAKRDNERISSTSKPSPGSQGVPPRDTGVSPNYAASILARMGGAKGTTETGNLQ